MKFDVHVDLRAVHKAVAFDLDIAELSFEFQALAAQSEVTACDMTKCLSKSQEYPSMLLTLARLMAAKPHSADVERCISANNILKTSLRSALNLRTESSYVFIHNNLPPTVEWNARFAVLNRLTKKRSNRTPAKAREQSYTSETF